MEKYHVLVVEDDTEIANAIKIYLQNQGYDVYVGNDGLEGLEIIEKETIHLAIVDIMMPRMDGLTMVSKLRERYDFPVIFLSLLSPENGRYTETVCDARQCPFHLRLPPAVSQPLVGSRSSAGSFPFLRHSPRQIVP